MNELVNSFFAVAAAAAIAIPVVYAIDWFTSPEPPAPVRAPYHETHRYLARVNSGCACLTDEARLRLIERCFAGGNHPHEWPGGVACFSSPWPAWEQLGEAPLWRYTAEQAQAADDVLAIEVKP